MRDRYVTHVFRNARQIRCFNVRVNANTLLRRIDLYIYPPSCVRLVCRENIPALPASDWSAVRIYPRFLCPIGPSCE
eukprot:7637720-Pyramimonas_sp.AAC.1